MSILYPSIAHCFSRAGCFADPVFKKQVQMWVCCMDWTGLNAAFPSDLQEEDFVTRDDFDDSDQLRIGNDGIFMLTFFSKYMVQLTFVSQQPKIARVTFHT